MRSGTAPIVNGAVAFSRDSILAVGPADRIIKKYPGHRVVQLNNTVLMPGLINVHTHLELPPLLDMIRAKTFPEWVMNLIKAKRGLNGNDYESAARKNIEMLIQTGTTTVGEICTQRVSPRLLNQCGLRGIIFHEIISMKPLSNPRRLKPATTPLTLILSPRGRGQGEGRPSSRLIQIGISPHAPHTVSESVLLRIKKTAQERDLRLCMHVAESKDEIRLLQRKKSGFDKLYQAAGWDIVWAPSADSSFEYLQRLGLLASNFIAVHAVQATDRDINLMKKTRTPVAHCPRSNKETGVGKMPLKKFLDAGITVGLGTDSLASSQSLNMWDEMRYALQIHKNSGISARDIFEIATLGGAKALGMEHEIGSLEPDKKADIIAVPLPEKNTGDIYSDLLRETKSCIMNVVNGRIIYSPQSSQRKSF